MCFNPLIDREMKEKFYLLENGKVIAEKEVELPKTVNEIKLSLLICLTHNQLDDLEEKYDCDKIEEFYDKFNIVKW